VSATVELPPTPPNPLSAATSRSRGRRGRRTSAAVLTVALGAGALSVAAHAVTDEDTRQEVFRGLDALVVDLDAGSVELVAAADGTTTVTTTRRWRHRTPASELRRDGDRLSVASACPDADWRAVASRCEVRYRIAVPPEVGVTVAVDAAAVTGSDLTTQQLSVRAAAGDVRLDFAAAPRAVLAHSVVGEVRISVPDGRYRVEADSALGEVDVDVPDDPRASRLIDVRTSAGDVTVRPR